MGGMKGEVGSWGKQEVPSVGHWQREVGKLRAVLGIWWSLMLASIHVAAAATRQMSGSCCGHSTHDTEMGRRWMHRS